VVLPTAGLDAGIAWLVVIVVRVAGRGKVYRDI
jgi:hypothetical protein